MKNQNLSVEEKVNRTLESLDGINAVDVPVGLEESIFTRIQKEHSSSVKSVKSNFYWAAAVLLLAINILAVVSSSSNSSSENSISTNIKNTKENSSPQEQVVNYYFSGGTSWY